MTGRPRTTCNDYRDEMTLLALKRRLRSTELTDQERRQIEEEIRRFEKKTGMA